MQFGSPEFNAAVAAFAAVVAGVSASIALLSVFITRKNWRDSNRPVVTAYVDEETGGPGITVFSLYLTNTGNRPATGVQLLAKSPDIDKIIAPGAEEKRRKHIMDIFTSESRVSVLKPDETLISSFGLASMDPSEKWLEYGIEIPVVIRYADTEGRKYKTKVPLRTRPRTGFGGGVWQNQKKSGT